MEKQESKIKSFKDLVAYQKAHSLVLCIYPLTKKFPDEEKFGLTSQMRRSAISVTSNIAEGFGRGTSRDKAQFYSIAKGSIYELESQVLVAKDLGFIPENDANDLVGMFEDVIRLISGLIRSAESR